MTLLQVEALGEGLLFLSLVLGTIMHEAAHAVAACALGLDVRTVSLGQGPAAAHRRIRGVLFVLRWVPWSGYVGIAARPGMSRAAFVGMVAAAPATNAILLVAVIVLDQVWPYYDAALVPLGMGQAILVLLTLLPFHSRSQGGRNPSDGLQLWVQLRHRPPDLFTTQYAAVAALLFAADTELPAPSARAPDLIYNILRRDRRTDVWAAHDAALAVEGIVQGGELNPVERALALEFLAANETLFHGTRASAAQLDRWSTEARLLAPGNATTITRAGVLATTGRGADAEALLRPLLGKTTSPVEGFLVRLHLAQAAADQGRRCEAIEMLAQTRQAARAKSPLRPILRRMVEQAATRPPLAIPSAAMDPAPHAAITRA